jgi:hypothetical protein
VEEAIMGDRSVSKRAVGENDKSKEGEPYREQKIAQHKQRQFRGHLWFSDYYERRDKNWFTNIAEEPVSFCKQVVDFLGALRRMIKGKTVK